MSEPIPKTSAASSAPSTCEIRSRGRPQDDIIDSFVPDGLEDISGTLGSNELARVTLDSIADAVISTDAGGKVAYMNSAAVEMTGWTHSDACGRELADVFRVVDAATGLPAADPGSHAMSAGHAVSLEDNCVLVRRDGTEVEIEDSAAPIHDRLGRIVGAVIIFRDVRFSHAMVEKMLCLARKDPLTGRANRFALNEQFELARRMARRHQSKIGVLFCDIDRFKNINDSFGHDVGDAALVKVAQHLSRCLRGTDTVCRYGGDEFVVLLSEIKQSADANLVAEKLRSAVGEPGILAEQSFGVSLSVGVSVYPDDGDDLETLVGKADRAMLQAKARTREPLNKPARSAFQSEKP